MTITERDRRERVQALRSQINHPIVDSDGHHVEFFPALLPYLRRAGVEEDVHELLQTEVFGPDSSRWSKMSPEERRQKRVTRPSYADFAPKPIDRATTMLPELLYQRLDDIGLDYAVVYPSTGNFLTIIRDEKVRRAACHAFNEYYMDLFGGFTDRIAIPAVVPMHTPAEAIGELDHAASLGYRLALIPSYVRRYTEDGPFPLWFDAYGVDSMYDYDPVWARCQELRMPVSAHASGYGVGWLARQSISNFSFTHMGHFAAAGELLCRSLLLGGVTRRFPQQRFAFLEGGAAWASALYSSSISHWEKRNAAALKRHVFSATDRVEFEALVRQHGGRMLGPAGSTTIEEWLWSGGGEGTAADDEWEAAGIASKADFRARFVEPFFFGAEADDPTTVSAFSLSNPLRARLNVLFSSDIGHFDVPDMLEVLGEAHEGVEEGWMTANDFRDFTFTNPVRFLTDMNPGFFAGTRIEEAVGEIVSA
jgi:predicted TIM-barrel fold metal-dependent hydrolase